MKTKRLNILAVLLVLLFSMTHLVGCSSGSEEGDGETATAESEEGGEEASEDAEELDSEETAENEEGEESSEEGEEGEEVAEEGEQPAEGQAEGEGVDDVVADLGDGESEEAAPPADTASQDTASAPVETAEASPMDAPPPEVPESSVTDVAQDTSSYSDAPVPSFIPLKKIKDQPYKINGRLMNTVYVARPGDSLGSISQKVFGEDRTEILRQDNSFLANRDVKPGDKIYYNSTKRPDDASTMLTYYEDKGIAPQVYVTKDGDNIRNFSNDLLGYPNAWKEIWATNMNVESKDVVPPGIELKYWPNDSAESNALPQEPPVAADPVQPPAQDLAMNNPPPTPPADTMPPPPPPPMDMQQPDPGAMGAVESIAPPPPPPPPPARQKGLKDNLDDETTMALGVAGVLFLAAAALFMMIMKKNRSKKIKLSQTQV